MRQGAIQEQVNTPTSWPVVEIEGQRVTMENLLEIMFIECGGASSGKAATLLTAIVGGALACAGQEGAVDKVTQAALQMISDLGLLPAAKATVQSHIAIALQDLECNSLLERLRPLGEAQSFHRTLPYVEARRHWPCGQRAEV